jgi:acyl carrier protein
MNLLEQELKQLIIEALELEDVEISDIETDEPLFVEGLGLDSIDALELGLAIKKKYQIKLDANSEDTKKHFSSVKALAEFIELEQKAA